MGILLVLYTQSSWDLGVNVRHIYFRARQNEE